VTLSSPNAISMTLYAAMPAATATVASNPIHPKIGHSRRNACRISNGRCGSMFITSPAARRHASREIPH
jgi:hypothetical protein